MVSPAQDLVHLSWLKVTLGARLSEHQHCFTARGRRRVVCLVGHGRLGPDIHNNPPFLGGRASRTLVMVFRKVRLSSRVGRPYLLAKLGPEVHESRQLSSALGIADLAEA